MHYVIALIYRRQLQRFTTVYRAPHCRILAEVMPLQIDDVSRSSYVRPIEDDWIGASRFCAAKEKCGGRTRRKRIARTLLTPVHFLGTTYVSDQPDRIRSIIRHKQRPHRVQRPLQRGGPDVAVFGGESGDEESS